ncbi:MAG: 6-phosphogluconolactonase [Armatimonadetes bacterium]|nr:6-phosphogluconolactonase [Armatimonadota bacterium]
MSIRIFQDLDDLSLGAAEFFTMLSKECIAAKGKFSVALGGGNTPRRLHECLADVPYVHYVDWSKVHVYWGDERFVPPDDPASNEGMARETLLSKVGIDPANVFPMYRPGSADEAAAAYDQLLREHFPGDHTFDLVILGLGEDCHTASLFPGDDAALESSAWALHTHSPAGVVDRITTTPACLKRSREMVFLVSGAEKAGPADAALSGKPCPAGYVAKAHGAARWFVDRAAAANLKQ